MPRSDNIGDYNVLIEDARAAEHKLGLSAARLWLILLFLLLFALLYVLLHVVFGDPGEEDQGIVLKILEVGWLIFCWVSYLGAVVLTYYELRRWIGIFRIRGKSALGAATGMGRIARQTGSRHMATPIFFILLGAALFVVYLVSGQSEFVYLSMCQFVTAWHAHSRNIRPPLVLFLASSSTENVWIMDRIGHEFTPHRVVSLLETGISGELGVEQWKNLKQQIISPSTFDSYRSMALGHTDIFRTTETTEWKEIFHELFEIAKIVVLDARQVTPHVIYETKYAFNPERIGKVFFLVGTASKQPVLDSILMGTTSLEVDSERIDTLQPLLAKIKVALSKEIGIRPPRLFHDEWIAGLSTIWARAHVTQAYKASREGDEKRATKEWNEAVAVLSEGLENATENSVLLFRAACYVHLGELERAISDYEEVTRLDLADQGAVLSKAEIEIRLGRYTAARDTLARGKAERLSPEDNVIEAWLMSMALALDGLPYEDHLRTLEASRVLLSQDLYDPTGIEPYLARLGRTDFHPERLDQANRIHECFKALYSKRGSR